MKNLFTPFASLILIAACSGPAQPNWGEGMAEIAVVYCDAVATCDVGTDVDRCVQHNIHHLCELPDSCDDPLKSGQDVSIDDCVSEIPMLSCFEIAWNLLPESCVTLLTSEQ